MTKFQEKLTEFAGWVGVPHLESRGRGGDHRRRARRQELPAGRLEPYLGGDRGVCDCSSGCMKTVSGEPSLEGVNGACE